MGDKWTFKCSPFPNERFAPDAEVNVVGAPVTMRDKIIGHVVSYEIIEGELILTVDQD